MAQEWPRRRMAPSPRSVVAAERNYPVSKVRDSGREELPHIQGKEWQLHLAAVAMKRYPTSNVRETQVKW